MILCDRCGTPTTGKNRIVAITRGEDPPRILDFCESCVAFVHRALDLIVESPLRCGQSGKAS